MKDFVSLSFRADVFMVMKGYLRFTFSITQAKNQKNKLEIACRRSACYSLVMDHETTGRALVIAWQRCWRVILSSAHNVSPPSDYDTQVPVYIQLRQVFPQQHANNTVHDHHWLSYYSRYCRLSESCDIIPPCCQFQTLYHPGNWLQMLGCPYDEPRNQGERFH